MATALSLLALLIGLGLGYFLGRRSVPASGPDAQTLQQLADLQRVLLEAECSKAALEERAKNLSEQVSSHKKESDQLSEQLKAQFENLANRVLETNTRKLQEHGEKNLQTILSPLKERLQDFEKKVEETYRSETRERFALKEELKRIVDLNQQMTIEANNLTRALKSDVKTQGNWGELILERLLTRSGLREGEEYTTQGEGMKLKGSEGDHFKPDVIINLPDNKHLVIDSKVSLKSYEVYCNASDETLKTRGLKDYLDSIYKHTDGLSAKHYSSLEGLNSPDFVLLFMPLEGAFSLALQSDPDLVAYAWEKKVAFVSPTTLLVTLGTIASIWKTERQNKNALEIARQGGALYDKFVAFTDDLQKVGKTIEDSGRAYEEAMNKLSTGRGNLVARVESIKRLGAKSTKQLSPKLLPDDSETESPNDLT